ncbi:Nitrilase family, member 2 [Seminavis robusta]|uniref:Nitrilase family, member 2 n=1 Tax=Seminavis robusta TaxID=568900 RepID=A0A9N8EHS2_9STRA|nr:Nitrilase family, member 2 [Seminavis robusta]|eukprot:Sro1235_g254990.1 Nitrilase family, member 2 (1331) ;mRNA; f:8551-12938
MTMMRPPVVWLTASLLLLLILIQPSLAVPVETSYVLEPFDGGHAPHGTSKLGFHDDDYFEVSYTENSYIGRGALQVDYDSSTIIEGIASSPPTLSLSFIQENRPHICVGATTVSFWYQQERSGTLTAPLSVRVTLLDDNNSNDNVDPSTWEQWTTTNQILLQANTEDWLEVRVNLEDFVLLPVLDFGQQNSTTTTGNNNNNNHQLDLHRLRGFMLSIEPTGGSSGRLKMDHFALVGGEALFGAALYASDDFNKTVTLEGGWEITAFNSDRSLQESSVEFMQQANNNGTLDIDYLVEHAADWGGFLAISYVAPGAAYYNVSNAAYLTMEYQVNVPVSNPNRTHLRFILNDAYECTEHCDTAGGDHERYYSFHYVLGADNATRQLSIQLEGSEDLFSPFKLTGWSGSRGNAQLDTGMLKGYTFEFDIDQYGDLWSYVTGSIAFSNIATVDSNNPSIADSNDTANAFCKFEKGIAFNGLSSVFRKKEFVGDRCCEVCELDETCIYVLSTGRDCFLASHLQQDAIKLEVDPVGDYSTIRKLVNQAYWMDTVEKRGDFCDKCDCHESNRTIDCRGKELVIVPKTFDETFQPLALDLRVNPNLVLLGSGSLASIGGSLKELWLPKEMIHLGEGSLNDLPELEHVRFEDQEDEPVPLIAGGNIIARSTDFFGSVCCGLGLHRDLVSPQNGLTFCNSTYVNVKAAPGIDSTYLPFVRFIDPTVLEVLFPSSDFMSEAAEGAEECAQYCSNSRGCRYFSYDDRIGKAEPQCFFFKDYGSGQESVCCNPDHYADEEQTVPGWVSGLPPGTRHVDENATVIVEPHALVLSPENDYQSTFEISLGSHPLRGAVFVTPSLEDDQGLDVSMWPSDANLTVVTGTNGVPPTVGLYNGNMSATVVIKVSNIKPGSPKKHLHIENMVQSCDQAFTTVFATAECDSGLSLDVVVDIPELVVETDPLTPLSYSAIVLGGLAVSVVLVTSVLVQKNKAKKAISFAQIEFLRLLLAGSLLTSSGAILLAVPPSDVTCIATIWFVEVGYTLELVPLIVKIAALNRLMAAAAKMRRITLKREYLFGSVAMIMGFVVIFLIVWSAVEPPHEAVQEDTSTDDDGFTTVTKTYYCSGYTSVWSVVVQVWNIILLLSASVLAFQTRKIKRKDFNESQTLAFLIYSHFVFICFQSGLKFLENYASAATLNQVRSILNSCDTIVAVGVYFVPKLLAKEELPRDAREQPGTFTDTNTVIERDRHRANKTVALKYQNRSVAEQKSFDIGMVLLNKDCFASLRATICEGPEEVHGFRALVVNSVMATDLGDKELRALRNGRWEKASPKHGFMDHCLFCRLSI